MSQYRLQTALHHEAFVTATPFDGLWKPRGFSPGGTENMPGEVY